MIGRYPFQETSILNQHYALLDFPCRRSYQEPVVTCDGQTYEKQNIQEPRLAIEELSNTDLLHALGKTERQNGR